jgi:flagellar protein FlgJ
MEIVDIPYRPYLPDRSLSQANEAARKARAGGVDRSSELYKVSQQFEAILIKQMLDVMRKTVDKAGLLDGGLAEEFYEDMLYEEYAKIMAESRALGLADMIYQQLQPQA